MFPFLLISAHGRIPCNWASKYGVHLAIHQGFFTLFLHTLITTCKTEPLSLYSPIKSETYSSDREGKIPYITSFYQSGKWTCTIKVSLPAQLNAVSLIQVSTLTVIYF